VNLEEGMVRRVEEGRNRFGGRKYLGELGLEYVDLIEEKNDRGT